MTEPNKELLADLFNSPEWIALKVEINVCLDNAMFRLKRENEQNRNDYAGEVRMAERILALEEKYKHEPNN